MLRTTPDRCAVRDSCWTDVSDKNLKENVESVDCEQVLEQVASLLITEWTYKSANDGIRHIRPVAQEFYALFGVGADDKTISTVEPAGIALAAIQALNEKAEELDHKARELDKKTLEIDELRRLVIDLQRRLDDVEAEQSR